MEKIPVEIVTHIFRFLGVSDRKEAALVCRKWYDASIDPLLLRDTVVTFHAPVTTDAIFNQLGRRRTPHLVLDQIDGSFTSKNFLLYSCRHLTENLQSISLKGSNITEGLFTELMARCVTLKSIDISFCNSLFMSGQVLAKEEDQQKLRQSLCNVTELNISSIRYLSDVTFNRLMYVCSNLEKLHLGGNQITFHSDTYYGKGYKACSSVLTFKSILDCIEQRKSKIKTLTLSRTAIDDVALASLAEIPQLNIQGLHLACCRDVSSAGVVALVKAQHKIETLDLSQCSEVSDGAMVAICENLHHLRELYLNKCTLISSSSVPNLHMLDSLERFEIASNYGIDAKAFIKGMCKGKLPKLHYLNVGYCSQILRDSFVIGICSTLNATLVHLDLSSSKITNVGLQYICSCLVRLRTLILKWNSEISDDGLLGVPLDIDVQHHVRHENDGACKCTRKKMGENILNLPKKQAPKPKENNRVNNGVPNLMPVTNLRSLQTLDISFCPKITDTSLSQLVFPDLRVLNLSSNTEITNEGLAQLAQNVTSLEELCVSQCARVSDDGLTTVVLRQRRLRSLSLANCDGVTDKFLESLQIHGKRLKHLEVSMCGGLTSEAVEKLEDSMKHLQSINKRLIGSAE